MRLSRYTQGSLFQDMVMKSIHPDPKFAELFLANTHGIQPLHLVFCVSEHTGPSGGVIERRSNALALQAIPTLRHVPPAQSCPISSSITPSSQF